MNRWCPASLRVEPMSGSGQGRPATTTTTTPQQVAHTLGFAEAAFATQCTPLPIAGPVRPQFCKHLFGCEQNCLQISALPHQGQGAICFPKQEVLPLLASRLLCQLYRPQRSKAGADLPGMCPECPLPSHLSEGLAPCCWQSWWGCEGPVMRKKRCKLGGSSFSMG